MNDTLTSRSAQDVVASAATQVSSPRRDRAESSMVGGSEQQACTVMNLLFRTAAENGDAHTLELHTPGSLSLSQVQTVGGNTALHIHVTTDFAEKPAVVQFVETILDLDRSLLSTRNDREETPLHVAAQSGQHEAIRTMLAKGGAEYRLLKNVEGDTALHLAVRSGCPQAVLALLAEAKPDDEYSANNDGETPLHLAIHSPFEAIKALINDKVPHPQHGVEPDISTLHAAVLSLNSGLVKNIMDVKSDLITSKDSEGQTPAHYAARISDNDTLKMLLERAPAAVHCLDNEGRTVAHFASQRNNVEGLRHLVDNFADCCEKQDHRMRNVVHYAASQGCGEALKYLLEHRRTKNLANYKDVDGNTPLHLLVLSIPKLPWASVKYIRRHIIPILKTLRISVTRINKEGLTAGDTARNLDISLLETDQQDLLREIMKVAPEGMRYKNRVAPLDYIKDMNTIEVKRDSAAELKKTSKNHSILAGLVFTVAFTAYFAVPSTQSISRKKGSAMLEKQPALEALIVSDAIAGTSSAIALLIYNIIALGNGKGIAKALFTWALITTSISMAATMIVFMAVGFTIAEYSKSLVIFMAIIASAVMVCNVLSVIGAISSIRIRSKPINTRYP